MQLQIKYGHSLLNKTSHNHVQYAAGDLPKSKCMRIGEECNTFLRGLACCLYGNYKLRLN